MLKLQAMPLFYIYLRIIGFAFVCVLLPQTTKATDTTITANLILSSCTPEPNPQLQSLSSAKFTVSWTDSTITCNQTMISLSPYKTYITWNYYANWPPADGCCSASSCHTTAVSTLPHAATLVQFVGSNLVVTISGIISAGPYALKPYIWTILNPIANQAACTTPAGQEISTGSSTLVITGGPTCTGVYIEEYYPGLH